MVYVGVLAQMLGIDLDKIYQALNFHFKGKTEADRSELRRGQGRVRLGRSKT